MSDPQPGDRYTRNGVRFTVQFVDAAQVYGVRYRADVSPEDANRALAEGREPEGYMGNCRISREKFAEEVEGADREPARVS